MKMAKNEIENRAFHTKKFGFTFIIFINGTSTAAKLLSHDKYNIPTPTVGTAVLHEPDEYDRGYGVLMAMKSAINKLGSLVIGNMKKNINGEISNFRNLNDNLMAQLNKLD